MKRKNILGILGLIAVAIITAIASTMPAPGANAADNLAASTTIVVNVVNDRVPTASITNPSDGDIVTNNNINVNFDFTNSDAAVLTVKNNTTGDTGEIPVTLETDSGSASVPVDLDEYGSFGNFTFTVKTTADDYFAEDSVNIDYVVLDVEDAGKAENDDPIIDIVKYSDKIDILLIQAYKQSDGEPLFDPEFPQLIAELNADGTIVLPFEDNNAENGKYLIVVTGYTVDEGGNPDVEIGMDSVLIDYQREEEPIVVPDTGELLKNLNISQTDYIITGVIVFMIITGGVLVYMKKSRR